MLVIRFVEKHLVPEHVTQMLASLQPQLPPEPPQPLLSLQTPPQLPLPLRPQSLLQTLALFFPTVEAALPAPLLPAEDHALQDEINAYLQLILVEQKNITAKALSAVMLFHPLRRLDVGL